MVMNYSNDLKVVRLLGQMMLQSAYVGSRDSCELSGKLDFLVLVNSFVF